MTRNEMIHLARAEYILTGQTKNISDAVRFYITAHPEECAGIPVTIFGEVTPSLLDDYIRPTCEACGAPLGLRINARDQDNNTWPTAWICETCHAEYYSDKTPQQWLEELKHV